MSRFLLVEIAEDLDRLSDPAVPRTTRTAVFRGIKGVPGVKCVTDISIISPQALEERMLPRELSLIRKRSGR